MTLQVIEPFIKAVENRTESLRTLAGGGRPIIGYFCTYTPIEVIHAAGAVPVRIMGGGKAVWKADSLTPNFICPYMRQALEGGLDGEYDYLSGVIQGYTCDVACGLVNIWRDNVGGRLFHSVPLPYNSGPEAKEFFSSVIRELVDKLSEIGLAMTDSSLTKSLNLYAMIRRRLADFHELKMKASLPMSGADFLRLVQAGFVMPPEDYLAMLDDLRAGLKGLEPHSAGLPVVVSGSLIEEPRILELLESCGGRVAADDLCTGLRYFDPPDPEGDDPMTRLYRRHEARFPCPSRSRAQERAVLLSGLARLTGARGVVFLFQKFCSPHLADFPVVQKYLSERGLASVSLEFEESGLNEGQMLNRLESFFEVLRP